MNADAGLSEMAGFSKVASDPGGTKVPLTRNYTGSNGFLGTAIGVDRRASAVSTNP
jgi:hypothetical protein